MIARSSGKLLATPAARRTVGYSRTISVLPRAFKEEKAGGEQQQERREVAPRTGRQEEGLATPPQVSGDLLPFRYVANEVWRTCLFRNFRYRMPLHGLKKPALPRCDGSRLSCNAVDAWDASSDCSCHASSCLMLMTGRIFWMHV
jgi:hypothetical protein